MKMPDDVSRIDTSAQIVDHHLGSVIMDPGDDGTSPSRKKGTVPERDDVDVPFGQVGIAAIVSADERDGPASFAQKPG